MIQLCKFFLFYLLISIDFHTFSLRNPLKIDPMDNILFWLVPVASVLALCFAYYFHKQMMKESEGTPQMIKIAAAVRKGAMSYLKQQYKIVGWVFLGLVILFSIMAYGFHVQNAWVPIAFLTGGFFSGLSGFTGCCSYLPGLPLLPSLRLLSDPGVLCGCSSPSALLCRSSLEPSRLEPSVLERSLLLFLFGPSFNVISFIYFSFAS